MNRLSRSALRDSAGHRAIAIFAFVDAAQRRIDLRDQLALAVARPQLDRPVGLARGTIGKIGFAQRAVLQMGQGRFGFGEDRLLPGEQQIAEIFLLPLVHERLVVAGNIIRIEIGLGFAESVGTYFGNIGRHEERPSPFLIAWLAELGEPRIAPGL